MNKRQEKQQRNDSCFTSIHVITRLQTLWSEIGGRSMSWNECNYVTFLGAFFTLVSSRMSSNRNMYMSTAFDISAKKANKH